MDKSTIVQFEYTNHKGITGIRRVVPILLYFGNTEFYPESQWILQAEDLDKNVVRDFAMAKMGTWSKVT